jgi:penicillin-binding protein 1A
MKRRIISFLFGLTISIFLMFHFYKQITSDLEAPEKKLPPSARILYSDGSPMYISRSVWMNLDEFPEDFIHMLLASEDRRFFEHAGIDLKGILRAFLYNIIHGRIEQGGSTITQQLVRSLYLGFERSFQRKIKEAFISLWIERIRSKDEILEMYLNAAYMGNGLYGFAAASLYYFGKPIEKLDKAEMVALIGIIKSPENFNPFKDPEALKRKARAVALAALDAGEIDKKEYDEIAKEIESLKFEKPNSFFDEEVFWRVIEEAKTITGLSLKELRENYEIVTTLDPEIQKISGKYVEKDMAFLLVDTVGRILGYRGKGVRVGRRQVGSAIKPVYYLYAMLKGVKPKDILPDLPIDIAGWKPENFNKSYRGISTVENALVWSRNVPSVYLFTMFEYREIVQYMRNILKISGYYPEDLTLSLGTIETSPEEISKFYIALSNDGLVVQPTIIKEIRRISGGPIYRFIPEILNRFSTYFKDHHDAFLNLKGILREVVRRGTGQNARIDGKEIFGKTGTAEKNAWFIGSDGSFIMILVKDGENLLGGKDVAPVWKKIAEEWGEIGRNFKYSSPKEGGRALLTKENVEYIDYEKLADLLENGRISLSILENFLSKVDDEVLNIFFERFKTVSPQISEKIKVVVREMKKWKK